MEVPSVKDIGEGAAEGHRKRKRDENEDEAMGALALRFRCVPLLIALTHLLT